MTVSAYSATATPAPDPPRMPLEILEATLLDNPFIPHVPTERQFLFLELECLDALYGGAAGGGKSDAILMACLQFASVPGYSALIVRATLADLKLPGALIDRSHDWLTGTGARWNAQEHRWRFPSGATLQFGYCDNDQGVRRYQSSEFAAIAVDEASQLTEFELRFLFSRLRRPVDLPVPLRYRLASNPGGPGHEFIRSRYLQAPQGRVFVPARLDDNPHLDREQYRESLAQLDPVTRAQLEEGDWDVTRGELFTRAMLSRRGPPLSVHARRVRHWDKGYSAAGNATAGALLSAEGGRFAVEDVVRVRVDPHERNLVIRGTAADDARRNGGRAVLQRVEMPPGAGVEAARRLAGELAGLLVEVVPASGDKRENAEPFARQCAAGNVHLVDGPWVIDYVNELIAFPPPRNKGFDDQCVPAGTPVLTALGWLPVEAVEAGDPVMTRAGLLPVLRRWQTSPSADTTVIECIDGSVVECTPNHPVFVQNVGWVSAGGVVPGMEVLTWQLSKPSSGAVGSGGDTRSRSGATTASTSSATPRPVRPFGSIRRSGRPPTGRFPTGTKSTTRTTILSTTPWTTWTASPSPNTARGTPAGAATRCVLTSTPSAPWPPRGTAPKPGTPGTVNTPSRLLLSAGPLFGLARCAVRTSPASTPTPPSVLRRVGTGGVPPGGSSISGPVSDAVWSSPLTETAPGFAPVRVLSVRPGRRSVPVYNLTVDGLPEYVAGGILVHNCDATSGAFNYLVKGKAYAPAASEARSWAVPEPGGYNAPGRGAGGW
jgi:phage terminase large subunit-like protein